MKTNSLFFSIFLAVTVFCSGSAGAETLFSANFDNLTKDYFCPSTTSPYCVGTYAPPGFTAILQNAYCGNYGKPNAEVVKEASRSGKTTDRGFRINLEQRCFPTGENALIARLPTEYNRFYLRWFQRMSLNKYDNFVKLFRMYDASDKQLYIPGFSNYNGATRFIVGVAPFSGAAPYNTKYRLDTEYTPDTWVCYEIFIDIPNQRWTLWVNGVNKGTSTYAGIDKTWKIKRIDVGGNQYGNYQTIAPHEDYIDYDDIIISTTYVGPDNAESQIPAPTQVRIVTP